MRQPIPCYQRAIGFLSRRSHFERELQRKLSQRGYAEAEVAETLERLHGEGLIDDRQTAREMVRGRLARAPEGRLKLHSELTRRGVTSEIAEEALDELLPRDDEDLTRQAAERWLRRSPHARRGALDDRGQASLARHLASRGFSRRAIFTVLREIRETDSFDLSR
ncbi:MAG: regulatory protein RecX [Acidobacteriota bacterium]